MLSNYKLKVLSKGSFFIKASISYDVQWVFSPTHWPWTDLIRDFFVPRRFDEGISTSARRIIALTSHANHSETETRFIKVRKNEHPPTPSWFTNRELLWWISFLMWVKKHLLTFRMFNTFWTCGYKWTEIEKGKVVLLVCDLELTKVVFYFWSFWTSQHKSSLSHLIVRC